MTLTMRVEAIERDTYNKARCRVTLAADPPGGSLYVYLDRDAALAMPLGEAYELTLRPIAESAGAAIQAGGR
jgi:hypothetical protein